jgi:hypothetical protein
MRRIWIALCAAATWLRALMWLHACMLHPDPTFGGPVFASEFGNCTEEKRAGRSQRPFFSS